MVWKDDVQDAYYASQSFLDHPVVGQHVDACWIHCVPRYRMTYDVVDASQQTFRVAQVDLMKQQTSLFDL